MSTDINMSDLLSGWANPTTLGLSPYPMEELRRIKNERLEKNLPVIDFGTGDPKVPVWGPIKEALVKGLSDISQYPGIRGTARLQEAQWVYLKNRFGLDPINNPMCHLPTRGSKEAVFHLALSLIGRKSKGQSKPRTRLLYPTPGYPVYRSSALFAGGIPTPITIDEKNDYLMEPWKLTKDQQEESAAIWVNYPHNPSGKCVDKAYWEKLIDWCQDRDVMLLSDDCYVDLYSPGSEPPLSPIQLTSEGVVALFSLSKRSGMTGYRAGFLAGDKTFLEQHCRARSNFGLGNPDFIQAAAAKAWLDEKHVESRRKIFAERMQLMGAALQDLGLMENIPQATFYLWAKVPKNFRGNDVTFAKNMAEQGVLVSPSSWLGEGVSGYFRMALVPDIPESEQAIKIMKSTIKS